MANLELTRPPRDCVSDVSFSMYNTEEIRRISVKEIAKPESFDELLHPVAGGLYDSSLGAVDMFSECASCGCKDKTCTGHAGHIELSLPVFNPIFFSFTFQLLKGTCFRCHRIFNGASSLPGRVILAQLQLLERGMISSVSSIQSFFSNVKAVSSHLEDTAEGDADGDNPKKQKSKRMTAVMEEEFYVQVEGNLRKLLKDLILSEGENGSETDCKQQQTRNICDLRRSLVTDFCSRFLYNRRKKCPYCRHTSAPVSRRAQQVIIIGSSQSRGKAVKKLDDQAPFDVPPGIDFGGATGSVNDKRIKQELLIDDGTKSLDDESVQEVISNLVAGNESPFSVEPEGRRILSPIEARRHLREVWAKDQELLQAVFPLFAAETRPGKTVKGKCPTDLLFCDVVSLPPSQFRPVSSMNGLKFESRQTVGFRQVLEMNMVLKYFVSYSRGGENNADKQLSEQIIAKVRGRSFAEKLQNTYIMLQARVNGLLDAALAPKPAFGRQQNADQTIGLRQILEKKEGMFRMYMMGKRVNFACRTVITPDPYMDVDGIGIPDVFAKKLTFPTFVNQLNLQQMRRAVVNGPKTHPGANCIVSEYGHSMLISDSNERERKGTAKRLLANDKRALVGPKKVLRQLLPDDYMLVNRQPTLHKPSIMAHKVHILRDQKTMRLNYSTCKTYNADFDGDEMNAHLPQDLLSQSECQEIANVINQYLVPKDGTPISGLIQDHIVSGVLLTLKDKFFSKEDYEYLVMSAFGFLKQKLRPLPPTIWKPVVRWTGKQVVSTVILNVIPEGYPLISLDGKAKTGVKTWRVAGHQEPSFDMSDSHVVFRNCELLVGVFDKAHYGPTAYGLVHCCYEIYGPRVACNLLSCFSRLFTTYLQLHGFTLGVADVLVGRKADKKRKKITKKLSKCGAAVMRDVFKAEGERECRRALDECYSKRDRSDIKQLDFGMKSQTDQVNDEVNKACLPDGLVRLFPDNGLLLMIECGAKGNMVNSMQMSCMLGQIELEGCRPPVTPSGRSLPSFKSFDHSPRAGGFVAQRFLTGVRPQEFFFHCMAGREGLIDTAVKTSRSGYLQRCLIKHLESVIVNYDMTVRDADQSIIQFQYGEDGLDIGKVQFLQGKQLDFLLDNFDSLRISLPEEKHLERLASTKPEKLYRKISKWLRKHPHSENSDTSKRPYDSPFTAFARNPTFGHLAKDALINEWKKLNEEERQEYIGKYGGRCPDPVASVRNPYCELGVLPEQLLKKLEELGKSYNRRELFDQFRRAIYWKGMKSLAEPGEAVGLLAAQSIGEPSTQMTLNTFHFAGRGEMNVTLGIPRLREILMTASERMSTPAAQVPFRAHVTPEAAKELHRTINTITLEDVLESIEAEERLTLTASATHREYKVTLKLSRQRARPYATSHLRCSAIMEKMEKSLFKRVAMELKKMCDNALAYEKSCAAGREKAVPTGGDGDEDETVPEVQPSNVEEEEVSDDERENVDKTEADASVEQMRQKHSDENEYVGEEEEADAVDQKDADDENSSESETESIAVNENAQTMDVEDEKPKIVPPKAAEPEKQLDAKRVKTVLNCANTIIDYEYDTKKNRWCQITIRILARFGSVDLISLFRAEAKRFPVQSIPGVKRCVLGENKGRQVLITEGVNLQAVFERAEHFEVNKIYCNDIHVVAKTYGIEAALKALIKETKNVFGNYGIVVDYRHLSLMADYMMHTGSYRPFNRSYMSSSTSPFQKMSFETTMKFLRDALEAGENDPLRSVSASIAAGRMPKVGTGFFDVLVKLK